MRCIVVYFQQSSEHRSFQCYFGTVDMESPTKMPYIVHYKVKEFGQNLYIFYKHIKYAFYAILFIFPQFLISEH